MKKNLICILLLAALALSLAACKKGTVVPAADKTIVARDEVESLRDQAKQSGCEVFDGVYVTELFSYSGVYPENGQKEEADRVAAARLVNLSPVDYKYMEFTLFSGDKTYTFFVSTLLAGAKMTVLEKNAAVYKTAEPVRTCKLTSIEAFEEKPSVCLDIFRIAYADGLLHVENKTKRDVKNVCVYYKNVDENGYFGGITYKVQPGDLPAGESVETVLQDGSLQKNNTRIVFVTYED